MTPLAMATATRATRTLHDTGRASAPIATATAASGPAAAAALMAITAMAGRATPGANHAPAKARSATTTAAAGRCDRSPRPGTPERYRGVRTSLAEVACR